jgi:ribosomal protein S18 acetylase RimI-like enzyme
MASPLPVVAVAQPGDLAAIREMLGEYAAWLRQATAGPGTGLQPVPAVALLAQLAREIRGLPGDYQPPGGALLMARINRQPVGMVALRPVDAEQCEMKRLYVRIEARGAGVGLRLAERVIAEARDHGYRLMLLDTLPVMQDAQQLYVRLGFRDTAPYYEAPLPGTRYMALEL